VGEERKRIRQSKRKQARKTVSVKLLAALGAIVVLVVAAVLVYNSNLFPITQVKVEGADHLTSEHLAELAAVPADSTLLRADVNGIVGRLEGDPWVRKATVSREFPSALILSIEERPIAAKVETIPDSTNATILHWLVSDDAIWLGTLEGAEGQTAVVSAEELSGTAMIKDVSRSLKPVIGETVTDDGVLNALAILEQSSEEMRALIGSISAPDKTRTTLTLVNNVGVAFGAAENVSAKEQAVITLLNEHMGAITYINVRVPDRATYRIVE
jgi:cell division protein FtsQ